MPGLTTLPATATTDEANAVIERDGGVIIEDFASPDLIDAIAAELRPHLDKAAWGIDEFSGSRTRRLGRIFLLTPSSRPLIHQPHWVAAANHFLRAPRPVVMGEQVSDVIPELQVGLSQVVEIYPGEGGQPLHRDDVVWLWPHEEGVVGPQARVQMMLAVNDFTEENGGTRVVPGSHLWGPTRGPKVEDAVPTVMKKGSALIWIGGTYHGGGTNNTTDSTRIGLTMSYDVGFLRQEEMHQLSITTEEAKTLPEDLQRLLGWSSLGTGWVEIDGVMSDPHVVLEELRVARPISA